MSDSTYLDYSNKLIAAGDLQGAEEALRARLRMPPARAEAVLLLAELMIRQARADEAMPLLREHASLRPCGDRLREYYLGERMNDEALALITTRPADGSVSAMIDVAARRQLAGDLQGAISACQQALIAAPNDPYALNHLGRALFNGRQVDQARGAFLEATRLSRGYAEAWHNLGHVLRAMNQPEASEQAYLRAVELAPAYRSALVNLGVVRMGLGRNEEALQCFGHMLDLVPDDIESLLNAGTCLHMLRRYDEARAQYLRVIALQPDNVVAHRHLGSLCNEMVDTEGALRHFRDALALTPSDPDLWLEIADLHERANNLDEAREAVVAGLRATPRDPGLTYLAGKLDRRIGQTRQAVALLQSVDPQKLHPRLHQHYYFELGTTLDRAGDTDAAYAAFLKGNELAARSSRAKAIDAGAFDRHMDAMVEWLRQGAPSAEVAADEDQGEDLCFLLGFPRSGTTLLDVMLDGHPQAVSVEERPTIEQIAFTVDSEFGGYPFGLTRMQRQDRERLRSRYRELLGDFGAASGEGRMIVDKMPIRTVHASFMHRLFPKARFLFALRHPCDAVLSNFMQHYAINQVFIHFNTLPESVRIYDRVMRIWQQTLRTMPIPVHYVRYESLVAETDATLQEACRFLGLPWIEGLSEHQKTVAERGRIKTNSYHQVTEPIYQRALGRWQGYRKQFEPLLPTLRPHLEYFGYSLD